MSCAGVVLTGGASRRMGRDKATMVDPSTGTSWAQRAADLLRQVADPAYELGPGVSDLAAVGDAGEGSRVPGGPLAALAGAAGLWASMPATADVIVVATDLPRLNVGLLRWLAAHPAGISVVPADAGRLQPLCARYRASDLAAAAGVAASGERRLGAWLDGLVLHVAGSGEWGVPAGDPAALRDADTPADAIALSGAVPTVGARR